MNMAPSNLRLTLVRHAEPHYQFEALQPLGSDSHLTQDGHEQALKLGRYFAGLAHPCSVYSSAMGRAYRTAHAIASATGTGVEVDVGLNEIVLFSRDERDQYRTFLRHWLEVTERSGIGWNLFPNHKTIRRQVTLIQAAFDRIVSHHGLRPAQRGFCIEGPSPHLQEIIIVAHSGTIQTLLARILDLPVLQCFHQFADEFAYLARIEFLALDGCCVPVLKYFGPVEGA